MTAQPGAEPPDLPAGYALRHFIWGVRAEDVRRYESAVYIDSFEDALLFAKDGPDGQRRTITYRFAEDGLIAADINYLLDFTDPEDTIDVALAVRRELSAEYGPPDTETMTWHNRVYRDHPERWGLAVLRGDVDISSVWRTPATYAELRLTGGSLDARLTVTVRPAAPRRPQKQNYPLLPVND